MPPDQHLSHRIQKLTSILDVAKAMIAQKDLDPLLNLILSEAAKVVEAERCSLFSLDRDRGELWSKIAQGAAGEIRVALGSGIAGTVAKTGEIINIKDAYAEKRFNREFDLASGYQTQSILCVPMRDAAGDITGVIEALNKRSGAFNEEDEELLLALGGQAAVAIENALLHQEISRLFEGFVSASVVAIEARDPTTAGHSSRVAALTLLLAESLERHGRGTYAGTRFSPRDIQELRYAAILHDFGKVGVRESVLVKADKLYPWQLEVLASRFDLARKDRQLESYRRRLLATGAGKSAAQVNAEEDEWLHRALNELDQAQEFVLACNRPNVMEGGRFERLAAMAQISFLDSRNQPQPLLSESELKLLSLPRGTLSQSERAEIESHVTHTFRFLSQIPWARALRRIPEIAFAHHEKLDGSGYPRGLSREQIPVQSRMMTIADIYDALTAADRPYKKAVPHALALEILQKEADRQQLDGELLRIFIEAEIPRRALSAP